MNSQLTQLAGSADGRYFSGDERNQLMSFANSMPKRVAAADAVAQHEDAVIRAVIEQMQQRFPNFARHHDQAWARQFRDVQLVVRADAQAMIFDDLRRLDDKVLFWLRTVFAASNYTPGFVRDCFESLRDQLRSKLNRDEFDLLQPYLNRNVEVLSDFPEPPVPAV